MGLKTYPYKKRTNYKAKAYAQRKFKSYAKKVVHSAAEKKWKMTTATDQSVSTSGTFFPFAYPDQGDEEDQYIGKTISISSLAMNYTWTQPVGAVGEWNYCRVTIFEWNQPTVTPVLNDIFSSTTFNYPGALFQLRRSRNYKILYDKCSTMQQMLAGGVGAVGPTEKVLITSGFTRQCDMDYAAATPLTNIIYCLVITDSLGAIPHPLFSYVMRLRYSDV